MSRIQFSLESGLHRRAHRRANDLGVSLAEDLRRLFARDLCGAHAVANPAIVFDLGDSGGSDVARNKDAMIVASNACLPEKHGRR